MTTREMVYAVLVGLEVIIPMYYNFQYIGAGEISCSISLPYR